ncbi:ubiquitin carboxyl-terminal hydrolase 2-like [Paramacrobiotus metropolitanus]|uniref:ubiquitin carboxyl-terminal hydrolase 2-like n=1 Tax=Paramacrobiotus metropolitanus TaxID=2943436 RepID=UPI002445B979|nr:ubiquitin carboxyl-terminal hydrolase 2-like [Paramacrobiotus metropolitanus]
MAAKTSSYRSYSNAIAEYTATVERLRSRRSSIQDSPETARRDSLRSSSLAPRNSISIGSTPPSYSSSSLRSSYVPRARSSLSTSSTATYTSPSLAEKRQSWRASLLDLTDSSAGESASGKDLPSRISTSSYSRSSDVNSISAYGTLPKRRTYTREESLDRAREILAKSSGQPYKKETESRLTTITAPPVSLSASGLRPRRESSAPPVHLNQQDRDSGIESLASSRTSSYDRSSSLSGISTGSSHSRRLDGVTSAYASQLSSRDVSPVRGARTPELIPYGMHREKTPDIPADSEIPGDSKKSASDSVENKENIIDSNLSDTSRKYRTPLRSSIYSDRSSVLNGEHSGGYSAYSRDYTSPSLYSSYRRDSRGRLTELSRNTDAPLNASENGGETGDNEDRGYRSNAYSYTRSRSPLSRRLQSARKSITVDESDRAGLIGLKNIGNTCFMNSILQCLSNTKDLRDYCMSGEFQSELCSTSTHKESPLISAFATVMEALWKKGSSYSSVNAYDPDRFHRKIQQYAPRFAGYLQQDAQEFLRYLLEGLHEDVNRVTGKPKPETQDIPDHYTDVQKYAEAWKRYLRRDNSKLVDLFVGQLKSSLVCDTCGHCSVTFDPFWDLALPIPDYRSSALGDSNVYDCLKLFTKKEILDGDERPNCERCKSRQRCTKFFTIQRFPKYLVIHLKRFSQERYRAKISSLVEYPVDGLDLSPFAADSYAGPRPSFSLYAVSCHAGSTHCGHYTAYCKQPGTGNWSEYNDSRVSNASAKDAITPDAYVLFYEMGH